MLSQLVVFHPLKSCTSLLPHVHHPAYRTPLSPSKVGMFHTPRRTIIEITEHLGDDFLASATITGPISLLQVGMYLLHEMGGAPWWMVFGGVAVGIRILLIPVHISQRRAALRLSKLHETPEFRRYAELCFRHRRLEYLKDLWAMTQKNKCQMWRLATVFFFHAPMFFIFSRALWGLMGVIGSVHTGGIPWIQLDLTQPPGFLVGLFTVLPSLVLTESIRPTSALGVFFKWFSRISVGIVWYCAWHWPFAYACYFFPSSLCAAIITYFISIRPGKLAQKLVAETQVQTQAQGKPGEPYIPPATLRKQHWNETTNFLFFLHP